jgi:hypothetical protein
MWLGYLNQKTIKRKEERLVNTMRINFSNNLMNGIIGISAAVDMAVLGGIYAISASIFGKRRYHYPSCGTRLIGLETFA